jgi:hypothetical protein
MIVFIPKEKIFKNVKDKDLLLLLYEEKARIWLTNDEIKKYKKNSEDIEKNKKILSKMEERIPLYDITTNNIYLIYKENVFNRVMYDNFRFPDNIQNDFLKNYNLKTLKKTYINIIYYYSNKVGKNITLCIRPSFLSYLTYIKPYYNRDEVIHTYINMGYTLPSNLYVDDKKLLELCKEIQKNDISYKIIIKHQQYIVNKNDIHRVIYYSLNGSYFINKYLRNPNIPQNKLMEKNIIGLWKLVKEAPPFDKDYKLYRFLKTDSHLKHLKIGDYYTEKSFISTTRNPFYESDTHDFGFILMLIKIKKNIKGCGLCIETFSNFKEEQEIILPPLTKLKLVNKNSNVNFYPLNQKKLNIIKYEFEFIETKDIYLDRSNNKIVKQKFIDLDKIDMIKNKSFIEKTQLFVQQNCNINYQFTCLINNKEYTFICEWFDSTLAYKKFFKTITNNGFYIYCQNPNNSNISLTIEISENNLFVNNYSKYSYSDNYIDITTIDAIKFISRIGYIFEIKNINIFQEYGSCIDFINKTKLDKNILHLFYYKKDFYNYIVNKKKKFNIKEINAKFNYFILDDLHNLDPLTILHKNDKDVLFQIYDSLNNKLNFIEFYFYILENRPDYLNTLEKKLDKIYIKNNPFTHDIYELNGFEFLYNNKFINTYPIINKNNINNDKIIMELNKSTYRLRR